jgi:HEAT repeat protein
MSEDSIDDLFKQAVSGTEDDDDAWSAVTKLHFVGTREILDKAIALTFSENPYHRARGADIIGQLGVQPGIASTSFVPERLTASLDLLRRETAPLPLSSAISAIAHIDEDEGIQEILRFRKHPNDEVRWHVASALRGRDNPEIVSALIELMEDTEPTIRDWATFGLGMQTNADSQEIRDALFERTKDTYIDAREEAIYGLAKRKDLRVLPSLFDALGESNHGSRIEEAVSELLEMSDEKDNNEWTAAKYAESLRIKFGLT